MMAIGVLLLTVIGWAAWRLGPTALERWFGWFGPAATYAPAALRWATLAWTV